MAENDALLSLLPSASGFSIVPWLAEHADHLSSALRFCRLKLVYCGDAFASSDGRYVVTFECFNLGDVRRLRIFWLRAGQLAKYQFDRRPF